MELVLVTFGGIFLLLSFALGAVAHIKLDQPNQKLDAGDRIASALVGVGLIATAIVVRIDAPTVSLLSTFGATLGVTVLYCVYLFLARSK